MFSRRVFLNLAMATSVLSNVPTMAQFRKTAPEQSGSGKSEKSGKSGKKAAERKRPDEKKKGAAESEAIPQPPSKPGKGSIYGPAKTQRWRFGVEMKAQSTPVREMLGYIPVPKSWTEQMIVSETEDVSNDIRLTFEEIDGVRVMVVQFIPLNPGQEVHAILTCEVKTQPILPPEDPEVYRIPKRIPAELKKWTKPTPKISISTRVKAIPKAAGYNEKGPMWSELRKIYESILKEYTFDKACKLEETNDVLRAKKGNVFGINGLFVAVCRSLGIPARIVWMLPARCYMEFYVVDGDETGFWFPADLAKRDQFGRMETPGVVFQRGDSFQPPWDDAKPVYALHEQIKGSTTGQPPISKYIREVAVK